MSIKKVLVWFVLVILILPNCAYAQENTIFCQPGDVFEAVFALTADSVVPSAVMGELEYDHDVFEMLPSSSTSYAANGGAGLFLFNGNPASVSFRVIQNAPNGSYTLNVRVLDTTATDRNESDRVKIEPVQVMIGPEQPANPASDFEYTIENDQVTITKYIGESTEVRIPDKIEDYPVTNIGDSAFYYCRSLTSITIPSSVISIRKYAFYSCSGLTSITISSGVTNIGRWAFSGCSNLTNITLPSSVTSIGDSAFAGCSNLTRITIPSSVTSIGDRAFIGCNSLTSITIPSSVTSIGDRAFSGCNSLTSITIPSSVTSIGRQAFYGCRSLASITIPSSVTSIGWRAFYGCNKLTVIVSRDSYAEAYCKQNGLKYQYDSN